MEKESFGDRLKRIGGCMWACFAIIVSLGIFLICGGVFLLKFDIEIVGATICIVLGSICTLFFLSIGIIVPFIQWKMDINVERKRVWEIGVLTDKIIRRDVLSSVKTKIIGWFVMTAFILFLIVPLVIISGKNYYLLFIPLITLVLAVKEIIFYSNFNNFRIVEDRITFAENIISFDVIDAATTHIPTKTPTLYFEKHRKYPINSMHIHKYYYPEELMEIMKVGEEVFIVFSNDDEEILYIYRKKYWSLQ